MHLLFHAQLDPGGADQLERGRANGGGPMSYEHQSLAGSDAIAAAGMGALEAGGVATATMAGNLAGNGGGSVATVPQQRVVSEEEKIGRNDPCWCGSGKKYKKCHGA